MARIAGIDCLLGCGNTDAAVSRSKGGALSVKCGRCEISSFAQPGTRAARTIQSKMRPDADAPADDAKAPPPEAVKRTPTSLLDA
jgi:hypothetical protein